MSAKKTKGILSRYGESNLLNIVDGTKLEEVYDKYFGPWEEGTETEVF